MVTKALAATGSLSEGCTCGSPVLASVMHAATGSRSEGCTCGSPVLASVMHANKIIITHKLGYFYP